MQAQLREIVKQLELCSYECEGGPLENNIAFQRIRELAYTFRIGPVSEGSENMLIQGVWTKPLTQHRDERGFFCEIIRQTDDFFSEGFGQWSHSWMHPGTIKAWHIHQRQVDWWYIALGEVKAVLHDCRPDSPTYRLTNEFMMGDGREPFVLKIPPGVAHGLKTLTPAHLFYITSRVYDPSDEGRIPHDDPAIGYDWLKGPEIK